MYRSLHGTLTKEVKKVKIRVIAGQVEINFYMSLVYAGHQVIMDASPRYLMGTPIFLVDGQEVTGEEALLEYLNHLHLNLEGYPRTA